MEDKNPNGLDSEPNASGLTRRQLGIAAAWAAPVIAVAATAPLAAASVEDNGTFLSILTTSGLSGNAASGSPISGTAGGELQITNVGGAWSAEPVTASYTLMGPLTHPVDLLYNGTPIATDDDIVIGALTWHVVYFGPSNGGTLALLQLTGPLPVPANGSTVAETPVLTFSTTSTGNATIYNPISWTLNIGAKSSDGPSDVSISDLTGKTIPAT